MISGLPDQLLGIQHMISWSAAAESVKRATLNKVSNIGTARDTHTHPLFVMRGVSDLREHVHHWYILAFTKIDNRID
jgi:hypothetical protein